jgi:basic membrane lipoprotein Med (substrate-binding protein (PBP1-ABC) superfamily)
MGWSGSATASAPRIRHIQTRIHGLQGYDLVIGHGFEFQVAAKPVAPDFPRRRSRSPRAPFRVRTSPACCSPSVSRPYLPAWSLIRPGGRRFIGAIGGTGADVILQNPDAAGLGVFQAAREGRKPLVRQGTWALPAPTP